MQSLLFNVKMLEGLKRHIETHFKKENGFYSPYLAYSDLTIRYPFCSRGIVTDLDELAFLYRHLPANEIGLLNRYAEQTEDNFFQVSDLDYRLQFKKFTIDSLAIIQRHELFFKLYDLLVDQILPIRVIDPGTRPKTTGRGFSSHKFIGGVFLDPCVDGVNDQFEYALNIVHEIGHQALMLYQWYDKIIEGDSKQLIYSVIRKVDRPAILSLHALVANTMMLKFCRNFLSNPGDGMHHLEYCNRRMMELLSDQARGISDFKNIIFTEIGKQLFDEMTASLVS